MKVNFFDAPAVVLRFRSSESLEDFDCGIFRALADRGLSNELADLLQSPTVLLCSLVWRRHSGPRFRGHILYGLRQREIVLPQRHRLTVMRMMIVMPVRVLMLVGALFPVLLARQLLFAIDVDIHLRRPNPTPIHP